MANLPKIENEINEFMFTSSSNTFYLLNKSSVGGLMNAIFNVSSKDTYAFTDYIYSLKLFPFKISDLVTNSRIESPADIKIGSTVLTGVIGERLKLSKPNPGDRPLNITINLGSILINEYYQNFIDYENTEYRIYLPYVGYVDLNPIQVLERYIDVYYTFGLLDGSYNVYLVDRQSSNVIITKSGKISYDMPLPNTDKTARELAFTKNTISSVLTTMVGVAEVVGGLYTGNTKMTVMGGGTAIKGGASFITNGINRNHGSLTLGDIPQNEISILSPNKITIITKRPNVIKGLSSDTEYMKYNGKPLNEDRTLGDLTGYTEVGDIHLENIDATDQELKEIESLLKSGVIL